MSSNWVNALDACASAGIIDYDAPADILGQDARYIGHPKFTELPTVDLALLPEGTKMKGQPTKDEFNTSGDLVQNPSWKKWAFGGIMAAATIGGVVALLASKGKIKLPKMPTSIKNPLTSVWNFIKKPFVYIASKFKKTP